MSALSKRNESAGVDKADGLDGGARDNNRNERTKLEIENIWSKIRDDYDWLSQCQNRERKKWTVKAIFLGKQAEKKEHDHNPAENHKKEQDRNDLIARNIFDGLDKTNLKIVSNNEKHSKFRATLTNTVRCINTLGERIAGGASLAFAPAPMCFNALGFFLQFWLNYVENLEKLDELFERCNYFIGRFHTYDINSEDTNIGLRYIATKLLHQVVQILRYSIETLPAKGTWKDLARKGFLGESKIDALIAGLSVLVEEENNILTALSFDKVTKIEQILEQEQTATDAKAWRITVSKAIGFGDVEPKRVWAEKLGQIESLPKTGDWLFKMDQFTSWRDPEATKSQPILVIEGAKHTGKTFLMASIAKRLEQESKGSPVVYYFHDASANRTDNYLLALVSKCLLWQCITASGSLIKAAAALCQRMGYNPNIYASWKQLLLENSAEAATTSPKRTFFVLIDGLEDELMKDVSILLKALTTSTENNFRILVSTRSADGPLNGESSARIHLRNDDVINNGTDVEAFIKFKLRYMSAFEHNNHHEALTYQKKIIHTIKKASGGDFAWMAVVLENLRTKHRLDDINEVLDNAKESRERQAKAEIERLNAELPDEDIRELNKAVLWTVTSREALTLEEMDAALCLGGHSESLRPLSDRLKPLLGVNESQRVEFMLPEVKAELLRAPPPLKSEASGLLTNAEQTLRAAEIKSVHRFLTHVYPRRKDYDKQNLETILWGASTKLALCYDKHNAHIELASKCLQILTSERNDASEKLRTYAGKYLLCHLNNTNIDKADVGKKSALRLLLVQSLTEQRYIDSLFWTRSEYMSHQLWEKTEGAWLEENRKRWLYNNDGVTEMKRWFSEPSVASELVGLNQTMMQNFLIAQENGQGHSILLKVAAERLARLLFLENTHTRREQLTAVYFLNGYVNKPGVSEITSEDVSHCAKDQDRLSWQQLQLIINWARKAEGVGTKEEKESWLWKIQVARTIFVMSEGGINEAHTEAQALLDQVQELDGNPWEDNLLACLTISEDLREKNEHKKARELLGRATQKFTNSNQPVTADAILIADTFLDLAELTWAAEDDLGDDRYDESSRYIMKSLQYDTTRYARYLKAFQNYYSKEKWSYIVAFLKALTDKNPLAEKQPNKLYLHRLVYDFIVPDDFQNILLGAKDIEDWEAVIDGFFDRARKAADGHPAELFYVTRAYGNILLHWDKEKRERDVERLLQEAVKHAKHVKPSSKSSEDTTIGIDIYSVVDPLARLYLEQARKDHSTFTNTAAKKIDHAERLRKLQRDIDVWLGIPVLCCRVSYLTLKGNSEEAKLAVSKTMRACLDVLSDGDTSNDWFGFLQLGKLFNALQDIENSKEAWRRLDRLGHEEASALPKFVCANCRNDITIKDGVHICLQCFGPYYFDRECYKSLRDPAKALQQTRVREHNPLTHSYVSISPAAKAEDKRSGDASLERWKKQLRMIYLGEKLEDIAEDGDKFTAGIIAIPTVLDELRQQRRRPPVSMHRRGPMEVKKPAIDEE
ncbi:hypothetical protein BKA66DRAFT_548243 [Pyrenochaeta sp. MPI-SDFR-AT-0127]|nr:hypothetical protein BKA66DRAFT_548243 [Pyrenochaeta sp. MPI-SDFR-AT-0127]